MSEQQQEEFQYNNTYSGNSTYSNDTFTLTEEEAKEFVKVSIYTPIIYLTILISVFLLFSTIYRKRKLSSKINKMTSIFPRNYSKDLYLQLKAQDPKPNPKVLKAALLKRGSESIRRMFKMKENENFVNVLYQEGSIGHDYFESFQLEKKLNELEMNEIAMEANSIKPGWAQQFFGLCQEITMNGALRRRLASVETRKTDLLEEWGSTEKYPVEKLIEQIQDSIASVSESKSEKKTKGKKK